jgi:hypothetical protein
MAAYLTKLWDEMAKTVLSNTKDIDARDADYDKRVSAVVWQTVRRLREGRKVFRLELRNELKAARDKKP